MGLIEQAARRLEELRRAGIEVPGPEGAPQGSPEAHVQPAPLAHAHPSQLPHAHPSQLPHAHPSQLLHAQPHAVPPQPHAVLTPAAAAVPLHPVGVEAAAARKPSDANRGARSATVRLDLDRLAAGGFITPERSRTRLAEEFRIIKRPLIANAIRDSQPAVKNGNLIMVTSSMPGEGKTFSSVNLAMSIAMELDHTVLLVDADVARPQLPTVFGLPETRGLLDRLENPNLPMNEILFSTNVKKLSFLPSGRPNPRATEMLASEAMNSLVEELGNRYPDRIIIFDSPPLLVTTESRVLAQHMGQIVFVIGAGISPTAEVKRALSTIEECPVKMVLLNKVKGAPGGQYGDGYGYGYGYGA